MYCAPLLARVAEESLGRIDEYSGQNVSNLVGRAGGRRRGCTAGAPGCTPWQQAGMVNFPLAASSAGMVVCKEHLLG